ncbi:uncharacterized protein [Typha angustifolia]|uniref:uncharacterized protein n=1 Tax=Typha angustifolia TaxID=59011 RepID=UPI003C303D35
MDHSTETPKRRSSASSSPDFEFWMVGNPNTFPQSPLVTADELFVDGVLLPLHLLSLPTATSSAEPDPIPQPEPEPEREREPERDASALGASITASVTSSSKRWRDIFKVVGEKKGDEKERRSSKERKAGGGGGGAAEININIWPFARSRSAGDGAAARRPKSSSSAPPRKSCSAPCSRSNSRGGGGGSGSGSGRRWAASPGRAGLSGGVHLGRSGPVWQLRRGGKGPPAEPVSVVEKDTAGKRGGGGGGVRVLNSCIGYRNQVSCRGARTKGEEGSGGNGSLFNFRGFFSKKVY